VVSVVKNPKGSHDESTEFAEIYILSRVYLSRWSLARWDNFQLSLAGLSKEIPITNEGA
jgi:hypothetical protein